MAWKNREWVLPVIFLMFSLCLAEAHAQEQEDEPGEDGRQAQVQDQAQRQTYVGTVLSREYHYPWCPWAKQAPEDGKMMFGTVKEAEEAGYMACDLCNPPIKD